MINEESSIGELRARFQGHVAYAINTNMEHEKRLAKVEKLVKLVILTMLGSVAGYLLGEVIF